MLTRFRYVKTYYGSAEADYLANKWFSPPRTANVPDLGTCRNLCLDGAHPEGTGRCVAFVFVASGCRHWPLGDARGLTFARCFFYDGDNHGYDGNMQLVSTTPLSTGVPHYYCACGDGDACDVFERTEDEQPNLGIPLLVVSVLQLLLLLLILCVLVARRRLGGRASIGGEGGGTALLSTASTTIGSVHHATPVTPPPSPPPSPSPHDDGVDALTELLESSLLAGLPYPEMARRSCLELQRHGEALPARVDATAAVHFGRSLDVRTVKRLGASLAQDANATGVACAAALGSVEGEAAAILFMHALDFGGGWRVPLHRHHGKGAWATVKPGVEAMLTEQPHLPAAWLAALEPCGVARRFAIEGAAELAPFAAALCRVCNELGASLAARGHATVSGFLVEAMERHSRSAAPAAALVQELVHAFPSTFGDVHAFRIVTEAGEAEAGAAEGVSPGPPSAVSPVCFFKKAQLVVGELYHRFRATDARFAFADGDTLTAFIDNVICAVLRKEGVVRVSTPLADAIDTGVLLPSSSAEEVSLRAAAMAGVELAAAATDGQLTPVELGNWLWGVLGKAPSHRPYPRHATRDTVFY